MEYSVIPIDLWPAHVLFTWILCRRRELKFENYDLGLLPNKLSPKTLLLALCRFYSEKLFLSMYFGNITSVIGSKQIPLIGGLSQLTIRQTNRRRNAAIINKLARE